MSTHVPPTPGGSHPPATGVPAPGTFLPPGMRRDQFGPPPSPQQRRPDRVPGAAGEPVAPTTPHGAPGSAGPDRTPRPFALTAAAVLTVTAGLQTAALVGFVWLVLYVGANDLDVTAIGEAGLFHLMNRGHLELLDVWPGLLGAPLAAGVLGFLLLLRARWPRLLLTLLGVSVVAWAVVWRFDQPALVMVPAAYIALCVILLWTPGVTRWLRAGTTPDPRPQPSPHHPQAGSH